MTPKGASLEAQRNLAPTLQTFSQDTSLHDVGGNAVFSMRGKKCPSLHDVGRNALLSMTWDNLSSGITGCHYAKMPSSSSEELRHFGCSTLGVLTFRKTPESITGCVCRY